MKIEDALKDIYNKEVYTMTSYILGEYTDKMKSIPSSISREYHHGESQEKHIEEVLDILYELMREFNIQGDERDILISASILHDISNCIFISEEHNDKEFQKLYVGKLWRSNEAYFYHPLLSSFIVGKYILETKNPDWRLFKIARIISTHMSHWLNKYCPEPDDLLGYILCVADYIASRKKVIFN